MLDSRDKTGVLRVINETQDKLTIQVRAVAWTQSDMGEDLYETSPDIVFFPKIFTLDGEEERIVRIGYKVPPPKSTVKTYRIFLEELPVKKPGVTVLVFTLRISIPIFLLPEQGELKWEIGGISLTKGHARVDIKNTGNLHFLVKQITATGLDGSDTELFVGEKKGWYVLPEKTRPFLVELPNDQCLSIRKISVSVEVTGDINAKETRVDIHAEPSMCTLNPPLEQVR